MIRLFLCVLLALCSTFGNKAFSENLIAVYDLETDTVPRISIQGTYKCVKSENFEAYLTQVDVDPLEQKNLTSSMPMMHILEKDSLQLLVWRTKNKVWEIKFSFGKEFIANGFDYLPCKSTVMKVSGTRWEVWEINNISERGADTRWLLMITEDGIYVEMICEVVVCKQFYARQ